MRESLQFVSRNWKFVASAEHAPIGGESDYLGLNQAYKTQACRIGLQSICLFRMSVPPRSLNHLSQECFASRRHLLRRRRFATFRSARDSSASCIGQTHGRLLSRLANVWFRNSFVARDRAILCLRYSVRFARMAALCPATAVGTEPCQANISIRASYR